MNRFLTFSLLTTLLGCGASSGPPVEGGPCSRPQVSCGGGCVDPSSDVRNCGACGTVCPLSQACQAGQCRSLTPDLFVTCWNRAALIGISSADGQQLPPAELVATDPVTGLTLPNANFTSPLALSPTRAWVIDTQNDKLDLLDISAWPPVVLKTIAVGMAPFDPVQVVLCGGRLVVLRTSSLVEILDPSSGALLGEVSLPKGMDPTGVTCDGLHTVYVTDIVADSITAVDVTSDGGLLGARLVVPDAGNVNPSPSAIVAGPSDGGPLWVSLQNLDSNFKPQGDTVVLKVTSDLSGVLASIDLGAQCQNGLGLAFSADRSTLFQTCGGVFSGLNQVSYLGQLDVVSGHPRPAIALPLSNPAAIAVLKNGLLAIADEGQPHIALVNPFDGGVRDIGLQCPRLPDGGADPLQFASGVMAAQ